MKLKKKIDLRSSTTYIRSIEVYLENKKTPTSRPPRRSPSSPPLKCPRVAKVFQFNGDSVSFRLLNLLFYIYVRRRVL